jgi:ABC-type transport system involved in multi-copper enzyme maturation permease subunit
VPIVDQSYQHWTGTPHTLPPAWVLARAQIRILLARRSTRVLLLVAGVFLLVWGGLVYVESSTVRTGPLAEISRVVQVDAESFRSFFVRQRLLHFLLCLAAADLVAADRRSRALQIYLARPLRARDYVLAKSIAVALPLSLATWIPAMLIMIFKIAMQAGVGWLADEPWLLGSILAYSALLIGTLTPVTVALSSLSASPRQAAALVFAFLALTTGAGEVLAGLTRSDSWRLLSVNADLDQVASALFATSPPHDMPVVAAVAALLGFAVAATAVLWWRIRPIEVVGGS